jgi:NAD(P)-dependent dehydrogenase (short-subunit alcohol dehydrogenase family)
MAPEARRSKGPVMELTTPPSFRLDGKRALITGGATGLGLAAGSVLARAGAHVTLVDINKVAVEHASAAIRERGDAAEPLALDVTDIEAVRATIAAAEPFDIVFNNAGTNRPALLVDVKVEDFDWMFSLNVRAAFFLVQAVARRLIEAKRPGSIINTSSTMGHVGMVSRPVYCATKHAVEGFTKAMALELAKYKIRVNTIAPTFVETPMSKPFFENKAFRELVLEKIKLGRLGTLEEIGAAVLFLASDASGLMTGTSMVLDGGWTAE